MSESQAPSPAATSEQQQQQSPSASTSTASEPQPYSTADSADSDPAREEPRRSYQLHGRWVEQYKVVPLAQRQTLGHKLQDGSAPLVRRCLLLLGVLRLCLHIGLVNAIGYWAQSESLMTTTASKSAFICSLCVIFVPLMDAVLSARDGKEAKAAKAIEAAEKKRQGGVFANLNGPWFPALLAAAGVACLELIGVEGGPNSGDVWALAQPLCFGVGFWLTERCSRKYPEETFGIVAAQLLTVAVLAIGWCSQAGQVPVSFESLHETVLPSSGSLAVPLSLLWTGLVTTSLTVFGETMAMKKISAAESTIILSTEPIWGTAFAAVLLGETIGWNTGLGAMLIVSACTWSSAGPAIQSKLLSLIAATGAAGTSAGVDVDDLSETVGTVFKELGKENIEL